MTGNIAGFHFWKVLSVLSWHWWSECYICQNCSIFGRFI